MKDPYLYEGTNVLKNLLDIHDGQKLDSVESGYAIINIDALKNSDFELKSIFDVFTIHKIIFEDIYEWAGNPRTIDIFKGESILDGRSIDYVFSSYINQAIIDLDKEFKSVNWDSLNNEEKIQKICYFVSEFWHIHPFREGNTRTSSLMLYFLIKKAGLHVNLNFLQKNGKYFRNALVLSCLYSSSKPELLLGIVKDSVSIKKVSSKKYETIGGYEVDKYNYTNHTIERIKTIEKPSDWKK